jgi:hypothetical protein
LKNLTHRTAVGEANATTGAEIAAAATIGSITSTEFCIERESQCVFLLFTILYCKVTQKDQVSHCRISIQPKHFKTTSIESIFWGQKEHNKGIIGR